MKASEIRAMSNEQIEKRLNDTQQELMNLRFQYVMGQLTDTSRFKAARRDVARMLTILAERENAKEGE
jgi:large subunit ribosomal protein L29